MRLQNVIHHISIFLICIITGLSFFSRPTRLDAQIIVTLEADTNIYQYGEKIKLKYTIENTSDSSLYYFDRSFVNAVDESGNTVHIFPRELLVRADWRESKSDYVLIEPGDNVSHLYTYEILSVLDPETNIVSIPAPGTIYFKYMVIRFEADNFYYDFENEHIEATTKIPIAAWTGTLESNEVIVKLVD
jgi:hypothetical protein